MSSQPPNLTDYVGDTVWWFALGFVVMCSGVVGVVLSLLGVLPPLDATDPNQTRIAGAVIATCGLTLALITMVEFRSRLAGYRAAAARHARQEGTSDPPIP